jgi:hypothetical protein
LFLTLSYCVWVVIYLPFSPRVNMLYFLYNATFCYLYAYWLYQWKSEERKNLLVSKRTEVLGAPTTDLGVTSDSEVKDPLSSSIVS